jgi:uncharacterized protein (TIGR00299 family) protein
VKSDLRGCELYFDCFAGIAGDMALGALLDLGVPEEAVREELAKLPVRHYLLERVRVQRGALFGTKIHVRVDEHDHHLPAHTHGHEHAHVHRHGHGPHAHTHWREIRKLLEERLAGDVRTRALAIFERIARVEAHLHGVSVDEVAFHEVGAVDSIVDIVGTAAALAWLKPTRVSARRVPLGGGTVDTAHGRLPVPAPATLELLAGAEVEAGGEHELTTPTGAAILAATVGEYGPLPALRVVAVGWGAGDRELPDRPNLLRVVVGSRPVEAVDEEGFVEIHANIDDMNPEWAEPLSEALFAAGAVDVWFTPILMKKGRPAITVGALGPQAMRERIVEALLRESTTIGVRWSEVARRVLPRRIVEVQTPWGAVPIKVAGGSSAADALNAAPEYEACRRIAEQAKIPIKRVYAAALAEFFRR